MGTYIYRFLVILFIACVGLGILSSSEVYADGGSFDVPQVNDQFNNYGNNPASTKDQPITTKPVEEEKGILDRVTQSISNAWDWAVNKVSSAWEWTKEAASSFWNWFVEILAKITEVVVDALTAAWDWIVKYKEYVAFAGVLILGVVLCFVALPLGAAVLSGMALSFIISTALNGWKIDKTTFLEAAIGGLLGLAGMGIAGGAARGLASGLGQKLITGVANSKVLGPLVRGGSQLVSKLPKPMQQIFSKAGVVGAVEGAGTSVADDFLHGRKIDWKKALISGVAGATLVGVGAFIVPKVEPIVNKVTTAFQKYSKPIATATDQLEKCFSYQQPKRGYLAVVEFPFTDCLYAPDTGGGSGTGVASNKVKPDPEAKGGRRPPEQIHKDYGKIGSDDSGTYVIDIEGKKRYFNIPNKAGITETAIIDGKEVSVTYNKIGHGFPNFDDYTAYTEVLDKSRWYQGDLTQFQYLNKSLGYQISINSQLKNRIENHFLHTLEYGTGPGNPATKLKKFLEKSGLKSKLTTEEYRELTSGKGAETLVNRLRNDPELKKEFLSKHEEYINGGNTPIGYVWHHHEGLGKNIGSKEPGTMQLVENKVHIAFPHLGGRKTWGGDHR